MKPPTLVLSREKKGEAEQPDPFRFVRLALLVIVIHTLLVLATPPNPIQGAFAIGVLLAAGYCALSLVLRQSVSLSHPELLALVAGFSILTVTGAALLVSTLGIPFDLLIIDSVGLPVGVLASLEVPWHGPTLRGTAAFLSGLMDLRDYSRTERATARTLVAAIFVMTIVVLVTVYGTTYPDSLSAGIAITGADGTPLSLPTRFTVDEPQEINVTAFGGSTTENVTVAVQLIPTNATGNGTVHPILWDTLIQLDPYGEARTAVTLEARGTWNERVTISVTTPGNFWLRFLLIESASAAPRVSQFAISVAP